ncbi:hypothetical protein ACROYT_G037325 [Oculina patagonica]
MHGKNCHFKTWKSVTNGASRKLDNSFAEGLGFVVNEENRIYNVSANTTKPASTTVKPGAAFAINIPDNNNNHFSGALGFQSDGEGASGSVQHKTSSIREEVPHASTKRKASKESLEENKEEESAMKYIKSEDVSGGESDSEGCIG